MEIKDIERFWSKVNKDGPIHPIHGQCWIWTAGRYINNYGAFWLNKYLRRAHRVAWVIEHGDIPNGILILHKCDNPPCVRLDHLFDGTPKDNMIDKVLKGRETHVRGNHKLTEKEVAEIRIRRSSGESRASVARLFNVCDATIYFIDIGITWVNKNVSEKVVQET